MQISTGRRSFRARLRREYPLHLMVLPALVLTVIFSYVPMYGVVIAFQKFIPAKGIFGDQSWVGLKNFQYVFSMPNFHLVFRNTVVIAVGKLAANFLVAVLVALLLNEVRSLAFKRVTQTIIYFPNFISWVIFAGILLDILAPSDGLVNRFLNLIGLPSQYFLGSNKLFQGTMIITDVWKNFGFNTIVYLAAITSVDATLYEAAVVDGASRLRQTWHITLPGMRMVIVLMLVLNLGSVLNAGFDQIFNLYSPQVYDSADVLDTLVYRLGLVQMQYGPSTAMGLFKSVISCTLISFSYWAANRFFDYRLF